MMKSHKLVVDDLARFQTALEPMFTACVMRLKQSTQIDEQSRIKMNEEEKKEIADFVSMSLERAWIEIHGRAILYEFGVQEALTAELEDVIGMWHQWVMKRIQ